MPTCCAPGCLNNEKDNPELHFFSLPHKDKKRLSVWLCKLSLKEKPAKGGRLCSVHFDPADIILPLKFILSPDLYERKKYELKPGAIPKFFKHTNAPPLTRPASDGRKRRQEHTQVGMNFILMILPVCFTCSVYYQSHENYILLQV